MSNPITKTSEITKIIKHALAQRYGHKNVSVYKGTGTARHWVNAYINLDRPRHCFCGDNMARCHICTQFQKDTSEEARMIVKVTMKNAGAEFATYWSDDGYAEYECFHLQTHLMEKKC